MQLDSLRDRLLEKEQQLESKSRDLVSSHSDQQRAQQEHAALREQIDLRDRKIVVIQKRVASLEEQVRERDEQVRGVRSQLRTLQQEHVTRDATLESLELTTGEQQRQIDK